MRWAKVPERLLDALVAVPRDQRESVAPGTALAGYVALAVTANFQTGEVKCTPAQLAARIDVTPRAARRTLSLLERVGALLRDGDRLWLRGEEADLQVPGANTDLTVRPADLQVPETDLQVRAPGAVPAGQPADSVPPLRSAVLSEQDECFAGGGRDLHLVEAPIGEQMELSPQRDPDVVRWLNDPDRLHKPIPADLPAVRAASHPPRPGPRLQDPGGTSGSDAPEIARVERSTTEAEGGRSR